MTRTPTRIVYLFTKDNCSLCVPVKNTILKAQKHHNFHFKTVDIENSPVSDAPVPTKKMLEDALKYEKFEMSQVNKPQDIAKKEWFYYLFRYHIPVVFLNDTEIARHELTESQLIDALQKEH